MNEGHGGFVIGSEMSRGVKDILVENCTFVGTDVGVRMKSALGRGGVVENITLRNIHMSEIKGEAVILTMSYVLNSLNRNETIAMEMRRTSRISEICLWTISKSPAVDSLRSLSLCRADRRRSGMLW